jgi:hypothetical protein
MEQSAIRAALAEAASTVPGLRTFPNMPDQVNPPVFFPGEIITDYDLVPEGGFDQLEITCHVYTSTVDTRSGSQLLDGYLARTGTHSVKAAVERDASLGGLCTTLRVERVTGYARYQVPPIDQLFFGARLTVRVWGP